MPKRRNLVTVLHWLKLSNRSRYLVWLVGSLLFFVVTQSCKVNTTAPKAPLEEYMYTESQIHNEKHLSYLNIPVQISIQEIEDQINKSINGLIYEDNSYEDDNHDNLKAKIWKISPIKMVGIESSFLFEVPLRIWVSAGYKFSPLGITVSGYKDTEFSIKIRFISKIGVANNWQLVSETMVESFEWITEPNIRIAGFKIPVKSMVSRILNRNSDKITKEIDNQVSKGVEIHKYALEAWKLAQEPYLISPEYNTWLTLLPTGVMMSPLLAKDGNLQAKIGFKGYTQTVTSEAKPKLENYKNLPPLVVQNQIPDHFRIALIGQIGYSEAGGIATEKFKGEQFSFLKGKYKVEITKIELYGQNNIMIIKAAIKGAVNGTVFLKGIPVFDPKQRELSLQNIEYDFDTKSSILKTANWLLQGQFTKMIEKKMKFPLGDQIEETKNSLESTLNTFSFQEGIRLKGRITEIMPDKVYLTPDQIIAVVFANGNVDLTIAGLK